jgi:hypothetical protein
MMALGDGEDWNGMVMAMTARDWRRLVKRWRIDINIYINEDILDGS